MMKTDFPVRFDLKDGTHVVVNLVDGDYEFHLTRLNSEKHNFFWKDGRIEESYETRFDSLQVEAVEKFERMIQEADASQL
jgi:hypothetical protein